MCFQNKSNMASISWCLDYYNDDYSSLVREDRVNLFGEQLSKFKKLPKRKILANKQHMGKIKKKYATDYGENK